MTTCVSHNLQTSNTSITNIIHIADIHIRQGDLERSRYTEYEHVFSNFVNEISQLECVQNETALLVIAGDVFHNKGKLDTPAIKLYFNWLDQLLELVPVIIICGNHDFRQEDPNHPDMIDALIVPYKCNQNRRSKFPIYYLKDTGVYTFCNLGIGMVSIKDTLKAYNTCGQNNELPTYPNPEIFNNIETINCKIAIFHGTISQSSLPNGRQNMTGYPLEWFSGYDCLILGDNHKQQIHNYISESGHHTCWGYPGSLIQQDFGEPIYGHGYILWNVATKKGNLHHIYNDYGMVTVKQAKDTKYYVQVNKRKDSPLLEEAIKDSLFPKKPRIRVLGKSGEEYAVKTICEPTISPLSIFITIPIDEKSESESDNDIDMQRNIEQMSDMNHTGNWIEYLTKTSEEIDDTIVSWITKPGQMQIILDKDIELSKDILQKIKERNERIDKAISAYHDIRNEHRNTISRITFKYMSWDYVMCYGQNNYFDFEKLQGNICLLNGRNATGKSAFLDVLCIGLYGEPSKQRNMLTGKKMTGKMIHDQRPANVSMNVAIMFQLNEEIYEVYRSFSTQVKEENWARAINATVCKIKFNTEDKSSMIGKVIICEGTSLVDDWINKHFGTLDEILMSNFMSQIETNNFFHMKQDEQKAVLDKALNLESIAAYSKIIKESILAHTDIIHVIRSSINAVEELQKTKGKTSSHSQVQQEGASISTSTSENTNTNTNTNTTYIENLENMIADYEKNKEELQKQANAIIAYIGDFEYTEDIDVTKIKKKIEKLQKKLIGFNNISKEDQDKVLRIEGEQKAQFDILNNKLKAIGSPQMTATITSTSTQELEQYIDIYNKKLTDHIQKQPKLNLSIEMLEKKRKTYNTWSANQNKAWLDDPDSLLIIKDEKTMRLQQMQLDYKEHMKHVVSKPKSEKPSKEELRTKIDEMQESESKHNFEENIKLESEKYKNLEVIKTRLLANKPTPMRKKENYKKWKIEYDKWYAKIKDTLEIEESIENLQEKYELYKQYIEKAEEKSKEQKALQQEIETINKELEEMNDIPYNKECWACNKQPMRIRQNSLITSKESLMQVLQKTLRLLKKMNVNDEYYEEAKRLETVIKLKTYYEQTYETMGNEKIEWDQAVLDWKNLDKWNVEYTENESAMEKIKESIRLYEWLQWKKWSSIESSLIKEIEETRTILESIEHFLLEFKTYDDMYQMIEEETKVQEEHNTWNITNKELIEKCKEYEDEYERVKLANEFAEWQKNNKLRVDLFERIKEWQALETDMAVCDKILKYKEKSTIDKKVKDVEKQLAEMRTTHTRIITEMNGRDNCLNMQSRYEGICQMLQERKDKLIVLENKFVGEKTNGEGYKEWVYRENVIPLLESEINRYLETIDTIRLKIYYNNKSFQYMLLDRGNSPTLGMASGYQRFIVGIALRLAFASIGATGQNIKHLFIDEGFVACDAFNLDKIQIMLRGMMEFGGYQSILLMSHLDTIRDSANMIVDIERNGMFSSIQYGNHYPKLSKITNETNENSNGNSEAAKKRGRPTKKKV